MSRFYVIDSDTSKTLMTGFVTANGMTETCDIVLEIERMSSQISSVKYPRMTLTGIEGMSFV